MSKNATNRLNEDSLADKYFQQIVDKIKEEERIAAIILNK